LVVFGCRLSDVRVLATVGAIATQTDTPRARPPTWVAVCFVVGALAASCSDDDDGGDSVVGLTDDVIGTCLEFGDSAAAEIDVLPTVPCGEAHSHEIFAIVNSDAATYPALDALETEAQTKCLGEFEDYVGVSVFDSELFFSWLVPTLDSWDRDDDRQIVCIVSERNGTPLVGTVRNIGR
jgi:hypothetical protein